MNRGLYHLLRDLHLYVGLFISPFVLVFAFSVFFLVHARLPKPAVQGASSRVARGLVLPADIEQLSGRPLIDALQPVLRSAGVHGEVGWVQHQQNRFVIPVSMPGRLSTVTIDVAKSEAAIEQRNTGLADGLVLLHKLPGPHLAALRMNWFYMRIWRWLADSTVYFTLFITVSGLYLWYALRAERKVGLVLAGIGAITFFGLVYALVH